MKALWQIILAILWRLRPVQALEANLSDVIAMGLAMFADDNGLEDLAEDAAYRSTLAAALFDAHRKADLLIYLRACEISGQRPRITSFKPDYSHTHASTDVIALWKSFHRLVAKFDDYDRLAHLHATRLKREAEQYPVRLVASLQCTFPTLRMVEANRLRQLAVQIASTCAKHWGRWIGASSRRDGGGGAFPRGPPSLRDSQNPTPTTSQPPARSRLHAPAPWLTRLYHPRPTRRNVSRETSGRPRNRRVH
jgi:hypothetical protein